MSVRAAQGGVSVQPGEGKGDRLSCGRYGRGPGREGTTGNQSNRPLTGNKKVLLSCLLILMSIDMTSYQQVSFGICQIVTRHVMHVSTMCPQAGKVS